MVARLSRCIWRAASSGSGSFVVASAITGYLVPESCLNPAVVNSETYRYFAQSDDKTQWERGLGVYTTADDTLTRATIKDSSNSGSAVTFSAAPSVFMGGLDADDIGWSLVPGQSGTIGTDVEYLDISLPTGYLSFRLTLIDFKINGGGNLAFAVSNDGGSTWFNAAAAYYLTTYNWNDVSATADSFAEVLGLVIYAAGGAAITHNSSAMINPGSASSYFTYQAHSHTYDSATPARSSEVADSVLETTGRMNLLRILPYGNGDVPPTSNDLITDGTYLLEGLR